jgi:hypothetical protein
MMKSCAHCRLPAPPAEIFAAVTDGVPFVFGICRRCSESLKRLSPGLRHKAINRAFLRVVDRPDMHYHRAFDSEEKARLFAALAADPVTAADVVAELMG